MAGLLPEACAVCLLPDHDAANSHKMTPVADCDLRPFGDEWCVPCREGEVELFCDYVIKDFTAFSLEWKLFV